jgi:5-methylcytosine-specific restriction endonuclease McrA
MRLELWILLFTSFFIANSYYDNYYLNIFKMHKKYIQMAAYGFIGITIYILFKRNPQQSRELVSQASTFLKYLPIDKTAINLVSPILSSCDNNDISRTTKIISSGKSTCKRSVSETKKKWVASEQNWKCGECREQLPAWFEVDHIVRLADGGSNEVDNLVAYCRTCHGKKTMMENL